MSILISPTHSNCALTVTQVPSTSFSRRQFPSSAQRAARRFVPVARRSKDRWCPGGGRYRLCHASAFCKLSQTTLLKLGFSSLICLPSFCRYLPQASLDGSLRARRRAARRLVPGCRHREDRRCAGRGRHRPCNAGSGGGALSPEAHFPQVPCGEGPVDHGGASRDGGNTGNCVCLVEVPQLAGEGGLAWSIELVIGWGLFCQVKCRNGPCGSWGLLRRLGATPESVFAWSKCHSRHAKVGQCGVLVLMG
jgi:hypothetical protein